LILEVAVASRIENRTVVLDGVSKIYERGTHQVHALTDVSLDVGAGELVVLLGPSGSGKTTMLNIIGGIEAPTAGAVNIGGVDVASLTRRELTEYRRTTVGFVFQFFNLVPTLTASENIEVIAELTGSAAGERARNALAEVGLADRGDHFPGELSGGEQQRVAIARALVKDAPVLLADEPTGSLDLETGRQILGLLRATVDQGRTVVLVTHNSAIGAIADRVVHLRDGRVADDHRTAEPLPPDRVTW
jgi:putative ABC transport system ATP-binding protein